MVADLTRMNRRRWVRTGLAVAASVSCPWLVHAARLRPVGVALQPDSRFKLLPVRLAERLGYFAAEGLPVSIATAADGGVTSAPVVQVGGFDRLLVRRSRGQMEQAVLTISRTPQMALGLRPTPRGGGDIAASLERVRIGLAAPNEVARRVAWMALQAHDVPPQSARFISLPDAAGARDAFLGGRVEALCYDDPLITRLQRTGDIQLVTDTRHLSESLRLFGGPVICACLSASAAVLDSHAPEVQALVRSVQRALRWLQTAGPVDLAAHADLAGFTGDPATFLSVFVHARETFAVDGAFEESAIRNTVRMLRQVSPDAFSRALDGAPLHTSRFLAAA